MSHNPNDLQRYTAYERANHWLVAICFILLALSGLALFHPWFFPLSGLFGGGTWDRILHPYIGLLMTLSFLGLFFRFSKANAITTADKEWLANVGKLVNGDPHSMPEQGKYNGGQKLMFWVISVCMLLLLVSGLLIWRAWFNLPVELVRFAVVIHAATAAVMIGFIFVHIYAAIWVKGTTGAMVHGTVSRAWAKQHHRAWYRQVTGKS
jgi:formate dehydrogenase subunit gamma